jgi:hypothetical protein
MKKTVFLVALAARLAVVVWAADAFPPTADGEYYATLARRLAQGQGYTWAWPDGVVTYAAHYPVGYPALVAALYVAFGAAQPWLAMALNAVLGAAAAVAMHALLARVTSSRLALEGALAVALHPALVPYTAAFMTEGVTASLLAIACALAAHGGSGSGATRATRPRSRAPAPPVVWAAACGAVMGVATLVRPQSLALAPVFGSLTCVGLGGRLRGGRLRGGAVGAAVALVVALACCAPWTARNCARMQQCALVSVNGGWNLAIGAQTRSGAWQPIDVPPPCREVFQEADKDACFGREAAAAIRAHPVAWLARAPEKLHATFDYFGAAPWYLHAANAARFPDRAKTALGTLETVVSRALLLAALVAVARLPGPRPRLRRGAAAAGAAFCVVLGLAGALGRAGAVLGAGGAAAHLALAVALGGLGLEALAAAPLFAGTLAILLATASTHAVFFGAGRYGLVVVPFVTALAFVRIPGGRML